MQEDHSKSINKTLWILNAAMVACCIIDFICCLAMERHYIFSSLTFGHISSLEEYRALPDAFTRFAGYWYAEAPFALCGILCMWDVWCLLFREMPRRQVIMILASMLVFVLYRWLH